MAIINSYPTITPKNGDLLLLVDTSKEGNPTKTATVSSVSSLLNKGYQDYVISLTQSGTNDPVVTELHNNTSLTFTWTRAGTGVYEAAISPNLDTSKTWVQVTGGTSESTTLHLKLIGSSSLTLVNLALDGTAAPTDNLDNGYLELRIYS
tara:strand:+ start:107 stop:556 length:450 start_codon:yes stop_codon:yes gene_type:complete